MINEQLVDNLLILAEDLADAVQKQEVPQEIKNLAAQVIEAIDAIDLDLYEVLASMETVYYNDMEQSNDVAKNGDNPQKGENNE